MAQVSSGTSFGQYKVVGFALDLTGRRLTDEICHVAAFCHPDQTFSQYIMPFQNVSFAGVRAHGLRVFTTAYGKFRVLKDLNTMKTLKTKSEYSALSDFLHWLQEMKGDNEGIVLAFHDNKRDTLAPFLLEALDRYKMTDDFFKVVKCFVNVEQLAEEIAEEPESDLKGKNLSLRPLSKLLLTKEQLNQMKETDNKNKPISFRAFQRAKTRSQATYLVLQKFVGCEGEIPPSEKFMKLSVNREAVAEKLIKLKEEFAIAEKNRREQQMQNKPKQEEKTSSPESAEATDTEVTTSELKDCKTEISAAERVAQAFASGESVC